MQPPNRSLVYLAAALGSLLLSSWYVHLNEVVNGDGVRYLLAAQGDQHAATTLGNWIFYSKLIQGTTLLTGLSTEVAAQVVNTLLDLLLVLAFLRLLETLGASRRALAIGAVAVLVLPYLNDNRAEIIRDHGYWAFSVVAMIHYVRLFREFSWRRLIGWYFFMGLATLFRIEGILIVGLMPLALLLKPVPLPQRLTETLKALTPLLLASIPLSLILLNIFPSNRLTSLMNKSQSIMDVFLVSIPQKASTLRSVLSPFDPPYYSQGSAIFLIYIAALLEILKDLKSSLSWPFFAVLVLSMLNTPLKTSMPTFYCRPLMAYGAVSLVILFLQVIRNFVMVSRYTMALALMLLPVVVFALDELWQRYREKEIGPALPAVVGLAVLGLLADSIIESPSHKGYFVEAGRWAVAHLPANSRSLTDDDALRIQYYVNDRKPGNRAVEPYQPGQSRLENFSHAFVKDPTGPLARALEAQGAEKIASIPRGKGKELAIYRVSPTR